MFKNFMKLFKNHPGLGAGLFLGLVVAVALLISWAVTCGLIYLITLCFGWEYNIGIATGIWLFMFLARSIFSHTTTVKN